MAGTGEGVHAWEYWGGGGGVRVMPWAGGEGGREATRRLHACWEASTPGRGRGWRGGESRREGGEWEEGEKWDAVGVGVGVGGRVGLARRLLVCCGRGGGG